VIGAKARKMGVDKVQHARLDRNGKAHFHLEIIMLIGP
jgi:hypothetical protein